MAINYTIDETDKLSYRGEFEQYREGHTTKHVPVIDKITSDPLTIYRKYNKFPWELLVHSFLILIATTQVILFVSSIGGYSRSDQNVFYKWFLDENITMEEVKQPILYKYFYTINELKEHMNQTFNTYFGLEESNVNFFENYEVVNTSVGNETAKPVVIMDLFYLPGSEVNTSNIQRVFNESYYGMFSDTEEISVIKDILYFVTKIRFTYHLRNKFPMETATNTEWYNWDVYQNFDFADRNHLILKLQMDKTYWDDSIFGNFWARYIWLQLLWIVFAFILMLLNIYHISNITKSVNRLRDKFQTYKERKQTSYKTHLKWLNQRHTINSSSKSLKKKKFDKYQPVINFDDADENFEPPKWDEITSNDKLNLINKWSFIIILSWLCLIIGSFFLMINTRSIGLNGEMFIGFGVFLTWLSLIKYYEHVPGFNIILNTIANWAEIVLKGVIGIFPVFIGYGIIGTCIFYRSQRFWTLSTTMFTLWSIMFGDILFDVWHDIDSIDYLFAQIYVYTFMGFTITWVLKIFIVIIQDGYAMQKYFSRSDWVKGVNQRTALHFIRNLNYFKEQEQSKDLGKSNKTIKRKLSEDQINKESDQIPRLYGVPLPSKGDPFVRLLKKSSKDVKSRISLIKMLRYEKYGIPQTEKSIRATTSEEGTFELAAHFGLKAEEISEKSIKDKQINESTPEGITNYIKFLLEEFEEARQNEIRKIEKGGEEENDANLRFKYNMNRILKNLEKYQQTKN